MLSFDSCDSSMSGATLLHPTSAVLFPFDDTEHALIAAMHDTNSDAEITRRPFTMTD